MVLLEEPIKSSVTLRNYVNGEWVEAETNVWRQIVNPATQKVIGRVPISGSGDLEKAVEAAAEAYPEWRRTPPLTRARHLYRLKNLMEEHFEELSRVCVMEHGKVIDEARGETRRAIENIEVACGIPSLMMGYNLEDIAKDIDEYVIRQPLGVFACIAPFNFPLMVPLWFMPYAVATGNTYIIKPSPWTPLSQTKIMELIDEAGFPPGVVNMIHGDAEVVDVILKHSQIKGVSFVGSTPIGRDVIYKQAAAHGKRVQAQCGAKNFIVVMPDTVIDQTVSSIITSFFGSTGQRCLSGANLVVVGKDDSYHQRILEKIVDSARRIRIGYGLDEATQMGPMQSEDRKKRVVGYIEKGIEEGARIVEDGRDFSVMGEYPDNCFIGATIFDEVTPDMTIAREEIFGPVMCVIRTQDLDEAIEMINKSNYGNAATIFTSNGRIARKFQYEVECGNIGINIGIAAPMAFFPFSGMKDSFFGDLHGQGLEAIRFFTESKVVIQRWF
ncbi:CoA-acylating methylmalonate-semialdehyde dehydrogenase [Candidatus Bathyarchaeota archaeon]|nr:CoA-acylating methylmalonate-semialdehyde dehydrogenase [Candidatus Bathyarchaeota archaeon]